MQKERVSVGDVIYLEANSGAVKRSELPFFGIFAHCLVLESADLMLMLQNLI